MSDAQRRRPFWYLRRRRAEVGADVDEEIRVHLAMRAEALVAQGWSLAEARREARRRFGDIDSTRQYCRTQNEQKESAMQRGLWWEDVRQDVRVSWRSLRRAPLLALTIIVTVGLGIGATTVIASGIHAALLRPLPYADPERLVWIYTDAPPFMFRFSVADYLALSEQQTQFARVAAFTDRAVAYSDGASADVVRGRAVTWTYFSTLGITPALGRDLSEADGRPGSPPVVLLSQPFWRQRLGGRPDVIGRAVTLDGTPHIVVGVLPPLSGPLERRQEFFVAAQLSTPPRRGPFPYWVIGRLAPGVAAEAAQSELRAINRRIFPIWRVSYQDDKATWSLLSLKERLVGDVKTMAGLALAAVAVVWLIACANASSLLMARVASRRRELAVRVALGASRGRVVRHLLVESACLALGAAVVGSALAIAGVRVLQSAGTAYFPRTEEIGVGGVTVAVLAALTAMSAVMFGLIPALYGPRSRAAHVLQAERAGSASTGVRRWRQVLVGSQFVVATPLLVVSALLLVSLDRLRDVDLGFDRENVLTAAVRLPAALYRDPAASAGFWRELTARLEALPGVGGVAFTTALPPNNASNINNFDLEEAPTPPGQSQPSVPFIGVTPSYFPLLGLTLVEGRALDDRDAPAGELLAVVVDQAWARRFFPHTSPIGKRFKEGGCTTCSWTTVVGLVSDVQYVGLDRPNEGTVYYALAPTLTRYLTLRTSLAADVQTPAVTAAVRELDANVALTGVATIDELVDQSLQRPRALSLLIGGFALVALVLSIVGIYGVLAFYVQQHATDIGVRMALGGSAGRVWRTIVGQGLTVVVAGVGLGLASAVASTRLFASLLFEVGATDPAVFLIVSVFLLLVALAACAVPARRAVAAAPAAILRHE